mgnify:CR=1 FL=1
MCIQFFFYRKKKTKSLQKWKVCDPRFKGYELEGHTCTIKCKVSDIRPSPPFRYGPRYRDKFICFLLCKYLLKGSTIFNFYFRSSPNKYDVEKMGSWNLNR